jgi:hypothetical protein
MIRYRVAILVVVHKEAAMMKTLITLVTLLFSTGCMTKPYDYEYISLEQIRGIKVISYGRSEMSRIKSDNNMPIRYEIPRKNYVLVFELDKKSHWPSIYVSAKSLNGMGLIIEAIPTGDCGGFDGLGIDYELDGMQALRYEWLPLLNRGCKVTDGEDYSNQQVIGFKIKIQGRVIFEEQLPFTLIKNGIYYETDGL